MGGKGKKRAQARQKAQVQRKGGKKASAEETEVAVSLKPKGRSGQSLPIPGLSNLGNTCFFNSVMQNIGQSHYFRAELGRLFAEPNYTMVIKLQGRESDGRQLSVEAGVGPLTEKLSSFLAEMQTGGRVLNPKPVFSEICKKASRFSGYHQQDSQELLRYLLDALRSEEINRIKRAILNSYKVAGVKKEQAERLTDTDRADIRAYGLQAHLERTFVDNVFGGVLASTVVCKECRNESTMMETFLDLSLPIGEDKNMTSLSSPMKYQARNTRSKTKKKEEPLSPRARPEVSKHQRKKQEKQAKKAARSANKKSLQKFLREERSCSPDTTNPPPETQDEKEDSVSSLKETMTEKQQSFDEEEEPPVAAVESLGTQEANVESCEMNNKKSNNSTVSLSIEESPIPPLDNVEGSPSDDEGVVADSAPSGYAAHGPLADRKASVTDLEPRVEGLSISETDNQETVNTQGVVDVSEKDNQEMADPLEVVDQPVNPETSTESTPPVIPDNNSAANAAPSTASLSEPPAQDFQSLKFEPNSLEASFKKFCTPELLTGANKFACVVCTKLKYENEPTVLPVSAIPPILSQTSENVTKEDEESLAISVSSLDREARSESKDQLVQKDGEDFSSNTVSPELTRSTEPGDDKIDAPSGNMEEQDTNCEEDEPGIDGDKAGEDNAIKDNGKSNQDGTSDSEKEEKKDDEKSEQNVCSDSDKEESVESNEASSGGADNEESSEEEPPKPKENVSRVVFCEATKQMLIKKPPRILTLHLKRFIQHGRRLQKNNKYVSFPSLLDVGPFLMGTDRVGSSNPRQLLYSLYGVVEHSGSMQGGHYIAYVRQRTSPTLSKPSAAAPDNNAMPQPSNATSSPLTPNSREEQSNDCSLQTDSQNSASGASACAVDPTCALNFDLTSTKGQWFYISDSHVRTASESEVMKSQAYLLFYEQLPLTSSKN